MDGVVGERRNPWVKTCEKRKSQRKRMKARWRMSGQGIKMRMALIHRGRRKIFTCIRVIIYITLCNVLKIDLDQIDQSRPIRRSSDLFRQVNWRVD